VEDEKNINNIGRGENYLVMRRKFMHFSTKNGRT
jgi:hypothetical protein